MTDRVIADYGLLSDCHSAALVSGEGSIDWLCFPRFDSPSVFGRILDPEAGHWSIRPVNEFDVVAATCQVHWCWRPRSGSPSSARLQGLAAPKGGPRRRSTGDWTTRCGRGTPRGISSTSTPSARSSTPSHGPRTSPRCCQRARAGSWPSSPTPPHWQDSVRRFGELTRRGIHFLDCGTSGGVAGARHGACFMVGGTDEAFSIVEPILRALATEEGLLHVGPTGSGHFVKLIHNMIEFGMVQSIGEGVELLDSSEYELDLVSLFHNWNHGSVIRGWLIELMEQGFKDHGDLSSVQPCVEDTGEQVWGVQYAMDNHVPIPILAQAVWGFYQSRDRTQEWEKTVSVLRHLYGGHPLQQT